MVSDTGVDSEAGMQDYLKFCWTFRDVIALNLYLFNDYGSEGEIKRRLNKFKAKVWNGMGMTESELLRLLKKYRPGFCVDYGGIRSEHKPTLYALIKHMKDHLKIVRSYKNFLAAKANKAANGQLPKYEVFDMIHARKLATALRRYLERNEDTLCKWFSYIKESDKEFSTDLGLCGSLSYGDVSSNDRIKIREATVIQLIVEDVENDYAVKVLLLSRRGFNRWMASEYPKYV